PVLQHPVAVAPVGAQPLRHRDGRSELRLARLGRHEREEPASLDAQHVAARVVAHADPDPGGPVIGVADDRAEPQPASVGALHGPPPSRACRGTAGPVLDREGSVTVSAARREAPPAAPLRAPPRPPDARARRRSVPAPPQPPRAGAEAASAPTSSRRAAPRSARGGATPSRGSPDPAGEPRGPSARPRAGRWRP